MTQHVCVRLDLSDLQRTSHIQQLCLYALVLLCTQFLMPVCFFLKLRSLIADCFFVRELFTHSSNKFAQLPQFSLDCSKSLREDTSQLKLLRKCGHTLPHCSNCNDVFRCNTGNVQASRGVHIKSLWATQSNQSNPILMCVCIDSRVLHTLLWC